MLVTRPLPVAMDTHTLVPSPCQWPVRMPRSVEQVPEVAWSNVQGVWAEGGVLRVRTGDGTHSVPTPDDKWLADWCRRVWKAAPPDRERAIETGLADRFDPIAAEEALARWQAAVGELGNLGLMFLAALVV